MDMMRIPTVVLCIWMCVCVCAFTLCVAKSPGQKRPFESIPFVRWHLAFIFVPYQMFDVNLSGLQPWGVSANVSLRFFSILSWVFFVAFLLGFLFVVFAVVSVAAAAAAAVLKCQLRVLVSLTFFVFVYFKQDNDSLIHVKMDVCPMWTFLLCCCCYCCVCFLVESMCVSKLFGRWVSCKPYFFTSSYLRWIWMKTGQ